MKTAHYYASKARKFVVFGTAGKLPALENQKELPVSGKSAARKLAAENNATPWNF